MFVGLASLNDERYILLTCDFYGYLNVFFIEF